MGSALPLYWWASNLLWYSCGETEASVSAPSARRAAQRTARRRHSDVLTSTITQSTKLSIVIHRHPHVTRAHPTGICASAAYGRAVACARADRNDPPGTC